MSNGILAEWRRGMVARGLAAAALLAIPVGVAAAIGFGSSVSGLSEGLDSLANGPDTTQAAPAASEEIDTAIAAIGGGETAATAPQRGGGGGDGPSDSGGGGGTIVPGDGGGGAGTGPAQNPSGGGATGIDPPIVDVPNGDPVGDLVQGLNDTLTGLLGGGN